MKRAAILTIASIVLLQFLVIPLSAPLASSQIQTSPAMITNLQTDTGTWNYTEGDVINAQINITSLLPAPANASLICYAYGMELWSDNTTLTPGNNVVNADVLAVYGVGELVFTGIFLDQIIPPVTVDVIISPAIVINYTGSEPGIPMENGLVSLFFEIENTLPNDLENASLTLYRYPSAAGFFGGDAEPIEIGKLENLSLPSGQIVNASIIWQEAIWGNQPLFALLNVTDGNTPYFIPENFVIEVEDYEESPASALGALFTALLYFPIALLGMTALFGFRASSKRKRP